MSHDATTRDRILDEAEKLFADNGFDATSLRAITAAAEVNLAAVNYHFGSKTALLEATVRRRVEPINQERLRRLDDVIARAADGRPTVDAVVDAFIRPAIEGFANVPPHALVGMLAMVHSRSMSTDFFRSTFGEVMQRFGILHELLPHLEADEVVWRLHFTIGAMIQAFNPRVGCAHPALGAWDTTAVADSIVTYAAAGFRAPGRRDRPHSPLDHPAFDSMRGDLNS